MKAPWIILCISVAIAAGASALVPLIDGEVSQIGPNSSALTEQTGSGDGGSDQVIVVNPDGSPRDRESNSSMSEEGDDGTLLDWNADQPDSGGAESEVEASSDWGNPEEPQDAEVVGQRIE